MADWKQHHADESEKVFENESVQTVMQEFADNMGFKLKGLLKYGLMKVISYTAQVARAQALGFDPELLRMTPDEANEQMLEKARIAVESGKPVWVMEAGEESGTDER